MRFPFPFLYRFSALLLLISAPVIGVTGHPVSGLISVLAAYTAVRAGE